MVAVAPVNIYNPGKKKRGKNRGVVPASGTREVFCLYISLTRTMLQGCLPAPPPAPPPRSKAVREGKFLSIVKEEK